MSIADNLTNSPAPMNVPQRALLRMIAAAAVMVAFAASGCGGNATTTATTNGLESMSAATVQRMAAAALESADSVHVKGTGLAAGAMSVDLRFDGTSSAGTLVAEGVRVEFTRIDDAFYVRAGRRALKKLGASAAAARAGAGRWLKLGQAQITEWEGLSLADLARQLTERVGPLVPEVAQTKLDGAPVVVVSGRDGSRLYMANSGVAYPLRGDYVGPAAGRVEFTDYGADFHIAAPEHPVDVGALVEGDRRAGRPSTARRDRSVTHG
jgi:hypothetical protein